ncbi:MAG: LacI family transcriptional regulator, partial [Candidatus Omnitrophica bacterium]|nr:LacI family transcriptional regulator [Candidatus Omnitrophota bacterium]
MTRTKNPPSGNVSIKDVAARSGVSITTVSRVINKFPSVKEKHRQIVLQVIKELKYQPSVVAQRLATGKSNVIALVIPRYEGVFYSFYMLELLRGTGTLCDALKLDLLLHLTDARTAISLRGVGGIIFADLIGNLHQLDEVQQVGIPCVVLNRIIDEGQVSCVAIDNTRGA